MNSTNTPPVAGHEIALPSDRYLLLAVFLAGIGTLGLEMVAARLLAPYFGSSQPIWAVIIGLTLIYLAIGYRLGGTLADHRPVEPLLYQIICWAGFLTGFIPLLSDPVLGFSQQAFGRLAGGNFLGVLVGMLILFAVPVTLMAMVSPFAIRLQLKVVHEGVAAAGSTVGSLSALSTLGSIAGAFLPVVWLLPAIGTARTIYLLAAFLIVVGLIGLRHWHYLVMLLITVGLAWYTMNTGSAIKSAGYPNGWAVYEDEPRATYSHIGNSTSMRARLVKLSVSAVEESTQSHLRPLFEQASMREATSRSYPIGRHHQRWRFFEGRRGRSETEQLVYDRGCAEARQTREVTSMLL